MLDTSTRPPRERECSARSASAGRKRAAAVEQDTSFGSSMLTMTSSSVSFDETTSDLNASVACTFRLKAGPDTLYLSGGLQVDATGAATLILIASAIQPQLFVDFEVVAELLEVGARKHLARLFVALL